MRNKRWVFMAALCIGLGITAPRFGGQPVVQAREQRGQQTGAWEMVTRGNMVYQDGERKAGIYAADFFLLQEKLSSVTGETFDPAYYDQTNKSISGADIAYSLDDQPAEGKFETKDWPQFWTEERLPEFEEQAEMNEEESAPPEVSEEEEASPGSEREPEISVSGNDCEGSEIQETAEKNVEEEGETL